jgi:hypothetical protein
LRDEYRKVLVDADGKWKLEIGEEPSAPRLG